MTECIVCKEQFLARNSWQKYCSNKCRGVAFKERLNDSKNDTGNAFKNDMTNERMIDHETLERILNERDKVHQAEIAKIQAEHRAQSLEARLEAIEIKLKEEEEPKGIAGLGFGLPEIVQAYMAYSSFKEQSNPSKNGQESKA
jgi:hypothetical protein